jgi:quercetin dioxygenase-like cupin family protein
VERWDLSAVEVTSIQPLVLATADQARAILIRLDPGQEYGDHQVLEGAWLLVLDGSAQVTAGGDSVDAGPGMLLRFGPGERREVRSAGGARLLLMLAPWPAAGHYRAEERAVGAP